MDPNKQYCPPPPIIGSGDMMVQQQQQTAPKSKAQLNSGNYIKVVPVVNGVQYHHRRKYPPQMTSDYQ